MHMTLNVMNLRAELEQAVKAITTPVLEDTEPMEWEWTQEDPKGLINLVKDFETKAEKGKLVPKTPEKTTDEKAREERAGSLPPPTPKAKLGTSKNTSRKRSKVSKDLPEGLGGGSGSRPPKNSEKAAGGRDPGDSSDNTDSDPSNNEGELPKVKIKSEKLLAKYISAMIKDQKHRDRADAPKPQPYR